MRSIEDKYWIIMVNGVEVDYLFDANNSETFDPTVAKSYAMDSAVGVLSKNTPVVVMSASHFYKYK